jgi:hypothetical protein
MACLAHETVVALLEGRLSHDEIASVDGHIDSCESCRALVAQAAASSLISAPGVEAPAGDEIAAASAALRGQRLAGRFRIERPLGRGAMGVVCEAEDEQLGVRVALKLLRPEAAASPRLLARLRQEVVLGRRITHPNVCRLYDLTISGGLAFVSMELLEGVTLSFLLGESDLDEARATSVLEQICEALAAAHAHGVVHRDLKPSNIMVGSGGRVVVMDFGLARDIDRELSEHGLVVGTPAYWAPEQARGQAATVRADLYSLGLVGCELFGARRAGDTGTPDLARVPARFRSIFERCLRERPEERFGSARELLEAVREAAGPTRRSGRGRRRVASLALAVGFGLGVTAAFSAGLRGVEPDARATSGLSAAAQAMARAPAVEERPSPARAEGDTGGGAHPVRPVASAAARAHERRPAAVAPTPSAAPSATALPFFE